MMAIPLQLSATACTDPLPTIGHVGRFVLRAELGEGASGRVFLSDDPVLERQVALKIPRLVDTDPVRRQRFLREAKSAARLRHPAIAATFESGQSADQLYIVSEYVRGETLDRIMTAHRPEWRQSAEWVRRLAEALDYAHSEGVVHRDVKPGNIIVDDQQQPRLLDFGIAKSVAEDTGLTTEGNLLGTPFYMSPEQARGDVHAVGPRSDQYSLGVVLYELLTGQVPFDGPPHVVLPQVVNDPPTPLRTINRRIPRDLEVICLKCLSKAPSERYLSCRALADDLARWLSGDPIAARTTPIGELALRWARRHRLAGGLAGAALVLIVAITAISLAVALHLNRMRSKIDEALVEVGKQQVEQQTLHRRAAEQSSIFEEQTRRTDQQRRQVLETAKKIEKTLADRKVAEQEIDKLVKRRQEELDQLTKSQRKIVDDVKIASETKTDSDKTSQGIRQDLKNASPLTAYAQTLQLALPAIKAGNFGDAVSVLGECRPADRGWEWHYLSSLCAKDVSTGWTAKDLSVEYAVGADDSELAGYHEYLRGRTHRYFAFSPDNTLLACIDNKREIKLLDAVTGKLVHVLVAVAAKPASAEVRESPPADLWLFALAFRSDGKQIAAIGEHQVIVWALNRALPVATYSKPEQHFLALQFLADGRAPVVSWTGEEAAKQVPLYPIGVLDGSTGKEWPWRNFGVRNILPTVHDLCVRFSSDDGSLSVGYLARESGRAAFKIAQIDLASGKFLSRADPNFAGESVAPGVKDSALHRSCRSPNGRRFINETGICETKSGQLLLPLDVLLEGAGLVADDSPVSFAWSPDGKRIAIKRGTHLRVISVPEEPGKAAGRP